MQPTTAHRDQVIHLHKCLKDQGFNLYANKQMQTDRTAMANKRQKTYKARPKHNNIPREMDIFGKIHLVSPSQATVGKILDGALILPVHSCRLAYRPH